MIETVGQKWNRVEQHTSSLCTHLLQFTRWQRDHGTTQQKSHVLNIHDCFQSSKSKAALLPVLQLCVVFPSILSDSKSGGSNGFQQWNSADLQQVCITTFKRCFMIKQNIVFMKCNDCISRIRKIWMVLLHNELFRIQDVSYEYVKVRKLLQIKFYFAVVLFASILNSITVL